MTDYNIRRINRYGVITPTPLGGLALTLEKYMKYERQGKQYMPNPAWATVKLYKAKKGIFPWGFINLVDRIFKKYCETHTEDTYKIEQEFLVGDFQGTVMRSLTFFDDNTLREYQKTAIMELYKNNGGILSMPTGSGKTKTAIEYLKLMKRQSLVIVTTLDIKKQWQDQCKDLPYVMVENYQNRKIVNEISKYDIIIFDESHHVSAKTIYNLSMKCKSDAQLIGLSATPTREDGEEMKLEAALGNIVFTITRKELIKQGYLVDASVKYFAPTFELSGNPRYMEYADIYKEAIVNNWNRNNMIVGIATKSTLNKNKTLILVSMIEHGKYLYEQIEKNGVNVIFLHGSSGKEERNQDLSKFDVIIATNIFNEGKDIPFLDVVVLAAGGKSSILLTQRIGRVLRTYPGKTKALIIDFVDDVKYLREHYERRKKILEEEFEVISDE